jgi:hypothetical protein
VVRSKLVEALEQAGHEVDVRKVRSGAHWKTIRRVVQRAKADVSIEGVVRKHSVRSWTLTLTIRDNEGERVAEPVTLQSTWFPGLVKDVSESAVDQLGESLGDTKAKPTKGESRPEPLAADPDADEEEADEDEPKVGKGKDTKKRGERAPEPSAEEEPPIDLTGSSEPGQDLGEEETNVPKPSDTWLRARIGGGWVGHSLSYQQDIYNRLRTEEANVYVYRVDGEIYPFRKALGEHLGIVASIESALSGTVDDADSGETYDVDYQDLNVGLRGRHAIGQHNVGFQLTYGHMISGLVPDAETTFTPDLRYRNLRAALDVVLDLGKLQGLGLVGFRAPIGFGELGEELWFPRVAGYGIEGALGLSYPITKGIALDLTGTVRRYVLEMNAQPEDAVDGVSEVAAGAIDNYLGLYLGVTAAL